LSRIAGKRGLQGNLSPQVKKSRKTTISSDAGVGIFSSRGARPSPAGKKPAVSYSLIRFVVTLDSPKTKEGGSGFERFAEIRSLGSTSISPRSSPSDLISPSSRFSDSEAAAETGLLS
jgi:hypothetical protein